MLSASACWVKVQLSARSATGPQGWRAALFTSVAILSLPMRSSEWMAGVQKLVTKCGPRLRVLALEMQVSMIDVAAVVQHIAQQYVGVGRFIAAALPRLTRISRCCGSPAAARGCRSSRWTKWPTAEWSCSRDTAPTWRPSTARPAYNANSYATPHAVTHCGASTRGIV
jgi:hypothetical protein